MLAESRQHLSVPLRPPGCGSGRIAIRADPMLALALASVDAALVSSGAVARIHVKRAAHAHVSMVVSEAPPRAASAKTSTMSEASLLATDEPVVNAVSIEGDGATIAVRFEDGLHCRFHSLWLRDACRDDEHVAHFAGERLLTATPVGPSGVRINELRAISADHSNDGRKVELTWSESSIGPHELAVDPPLVSTFPAAFLRSYAELVAETIEAADDSTTAAALTDDLAWLTPFSGFDGAPAQARASMHVWPNDGPVDLPVLPYDDVLDPSSSANLQMLQHMAKYGAVIVDGCPEPGVESLHRTRPISPKLLHGQSCFTLSHCPRSPDFADTALGGLQKDPTRPEANWKIVGKSGATSVSYDHLKRLNQHTDSSIPPHGVPALCLLMHYAAGTGVNTLSDGFAVAEALRNADPDGFELLATYGYDGERDFVASRVDSTQLLNRGLVVSTRFPIIQLDAAGAISRIQYNEVFRMPSTIPFDVFPRWCASPEPPSAAPSRRRPIGPRCSARGIVTADTLATAIAPGMRRSPSLSRCCTHPSSKSKSRWPRGCVSACAPQAQRAESQQICWLCY